VGEYGEWLNYAGGYSDMLEQRKQAQKEQKIAVTAKAKQNKGSKSKGAAKGKLTYKDKFALENIPVQMEEVNTRMQGLESRLEDPELYAKDPDRFEKTVQALSDAQSQHDDLEEEWLRLEMLREEVEG
ncbi:MAG: ABC transporter ATP-binding protein, partial [Hyphomicrobiaceae bacterium]|nr:ABC transporter ATP-binding protein [Hyphomicrobiaceae bacterium]